MSVIAAMVTIVVFVFYIGLEEEWQAGIFAQVLSSIAVAISVIFLVIDKLIIRRPHFTIVSFRVEPPKTVLASQRHVILFIQNDGTRSATSVRVKISILSQDYKEQKEFLPLLRLLIEENFSRKQALPVRVGDQFEVLVSTADLQYNYNDRLYESGKFCLKILSTFASTHSFYSYEKKEDGWKVFELAPAKQPFAKLRYLIKKYGFTRVFWYYYGAKVVLE